MTDRLRKSHSAGFIVLALAVALAVSLGAPSPPPLFLALVLAALVGLVGVPHGALDPFLARQAGLWTHWRGLVLYIVVYAGIAAGVVFAWSIAPAWSLAAFLIASAWHFAEDWAERVPRWAALATGVAIVSLPAAHQGEAVSGYYRVLAGDGGAILAQIQSAIAPAVMAGLGAAIAWAVWRQRLVDGLEIFAIGILAITAPPLIFFLVYFCGLHSPRHMATSLTALRVKSVADAAAFVLPFTIATVIVAMLAWPFLDTAQMDDGLIRLVFIGLAGLTVPHMVFLALMERRRRNFYRTQRTT